MRRHAVSVCRAKRDGPLQSASLSDKRSTFHAQKALSSRNSPPLHVHPYTFTLARPTLTRPPLLTRPAAAPTPSSCRACAGSARTRYRLRRILLGLAVGVSAERCVRVIVWQHVGFSLHHERPACNGRGKCNWGSCDRRTAACAAVSARPVRIAMSLSASFFQVVTTRCCADLCGQ